MNPTETDKTTDKTTQPAAAGTGAVDTKAEDTAVAAPGTSEKTAGTTAETVGDEHDTAVLDDIDDERPDADGDGPTPRASSGLVASAGAVFAAGLGVVGLSGSWIGRVAAERQTLIGQIKTSQGGSPADQISAIYGDAWHTTALSNGVFALLALIIGLVVLTRPRKSGWVPAVAVAGAALGALGLIVSIGMYFDIILALPSAGS
ncbi:hypothetical protein [Streptomyces sp. AM8-1-1]|uniref:hypothetical protein n=1 Tax=Streptomyces sp. AM8-1-1 TaxID=3075825 RepID=UPI0028C40A4E|nr:hypothetical protein [Streptomyces sp. AM8-1-1]WNO72123.1 hypothetical protein RPQ07_11030 [Streptomyces sp. AM8-1-1]